MWFKYSKLRTSLHGMIQKKVMGCCGDVMELCVKGSGEITAEGDVG